MTRGRGGFRGNPYFGPGPYGRYENQHNSHWKYSSSLSEILLDFNIPACVDFPDDLFTGVFIVDGAGEEEHADMVTPINFLSLPFFL